MLAAHQPACRWCWFDLLVFASFGLGVATLRYQHFEPVPAILLTLEMQGTKYIRRTIYHRPERILAEQSQAGLK